MTALSAKLDELGLAEYYHAFVNEGFDTWQTVLDITESDLSSLNVKLGHRRKLQRAIADWRGQSGYEPLPIARHRGATDDENHSDADEDEGKRLRDAAAAAAAQPVQKRKYRRHPKPDENAPDRPPSAYVIFSNQVRETLKGQDLSFSEIAKIVGERWQVLSPGAREACDRQAASAKEKYYQELAEYKKTPQYAQYQAYLADFKAKHANPHGGGEGKRSKLEPEPSVSVSTPASSSTASIDRSHRPLGAGAPSGHFRTRSSENVDSHVVSTSTSPATARPFSNINSPRLTERQSPLSASPHTVSAFRDPAYSSSVHSVGDARDRLLNHTPPHASSGPPHERRAASPPSVPLPPHQDAHDPPVRRWIMQNTAGASPPTLHRNDSSLPSVPSLGRTDTTASSASIASIASEGRGSRQSSYVGASLPPQVLPADATKSHRVLPQPVPTNMASPVEGAFPSLPNRAAPSSSTAGVGTEHRHGWSALVMAADMARNEARSPAPEDRPP